MSFEESQTLSSSSAVEPPQHEQSKKAAKKEATKQEKLRRRQESATLASAAQSISVEEDPLAANYGDVPLPELQSKVDSRVWIAVSKLTEELKNESVVVHGRAQTIRPCGKNITFLVIREKGFTVQCVVTTKPDVVSRQMVKYAADLNSESIVDIEGIVSVPTVPITGATQQVEVQVQKLHCVSRARTPLPINIEDAACSEADIEKASQAGEQHVRISQHTRLNNRVLELRTPANNLGIFRIQSQVVYIFRQFLVSEDFFEIFTPKLIAGSSEGGAAVFRLDYKGQPACLAQSPQLHKQMAICRKFRRVFEIGPVFRAENSDTHRHLCEFIGLDVEMEIRHYFEVMDIVDRLFVTMFDTLNKNCSKELEAVGRQYPFEPLKYLPQTLRLTFEEGIQMLKDAGVDVDPFGDLNTVAERKLGQLVFEKYDTEFYILHRYPLAVRPFYTMPCHDNPAYSNSFDVFIRGEEIISGAQRIHEPKFLAECAQACGIDVQTISTYIDSFKNGAPPHGGFGVGLERVVMLFCNLDNIRKTSLFPRDPTRLVP
ncbi:hypothetical protein SLA2020_264460 [Shorea laevis]